MAVTANYETVMVVTLKKGEEAVSSTKRQKAIMFSLSLSPQPSSLRSLTVNSELTKM